MWDVRDVGVRKNESPRRWRTDCAGVCRTLALGREPEWVIQTGVFIALECGERWRRLSAGIGKLILALLPLWTILREEKDKENRHWKQWLYNFAA